MLDLEFNIPAWHQSFHQIQFKIKLFRTHMHQLNQL